MPRVILIVDDDRELCELVGELLRAEGFDVEAHHTGEGAVELAAGGRFALVILDVMLPVQNGFEILRALRNRSAVPVILLPPAARTSIASSASKSGPTTICPSPSTRAS